MIVARHVTGKILKWREVVRYILLAVYFGIPWLQWGDRPAILLDIAHRKFYFPGVVIWPQEFYFLMLLLLASGLSLFLFTALYGRIWCGWACPQTVYVELFDTIGRLLLPSRYGKRSEKIHHKLIVYSVWILVSFIISFHFVAYFVPARDMISTILEQGTGIFAELTWPYFLTVSAILLFADIAFFREQLCVFLCPYARFQSAMLDQDSIVVAYDSYRGEPRRSADHDEHNEEASEQGDCTSCQMCVQVCPTGIDIREGLQVACINCGHCIDACTREMARFDKASLVNYSSMNYFIKREKTRFFRPRTIVYITMFTAVITALSFLLVNRIPVHLWVIPDPSLAAVQLQDGSVQNYYKLDVGNLTEEKAQFQLSVQSVKEDVLNELKIEGNHIMDVDAGGLSKNRLVISATPAVMDGVKRKYSIEFTVTRKDNPDYKVVKSANFTIPGS